MYKEYFKLIIRNLSRNRIYSVINIAGLSLALAAALLIYSHVVKEWKTDRFHVNKEHIYRVTIHSLRSGEWESLVFPPLIPAIKAENPGVKNYTRLSAAEPLVIQREGEAEPLAHVRGFHADRYFFDIFTFPFVAGGFNGECGPGWVVISKRVAEQHWGNKNPVGELLFLKNPQQERDKGYYYRVAAVMEDIPAFSTLQADVIADFSIVEKEYDFWGCHCVYAYLELNEGVDRTGLQERMPHIVEENYSWIKASDFEVKLQPLADIYFGSDRFLEEIPHGSKRLNGILCGITLLVLLLASSNYIMIKIAGLSRRSAGLAMQRCFGAGNRHLRGQLFWETAVHVLLAVGIAAVLTVFLHPYFVRIISPKCPYALLFGWKEVLVFGGLLFVFILFVTAVLSFYILRHLDRKGIKNSLVHSQRFWDVRKVLSVFQLCIFSALLCCSVVLMRQMNFVKNRQLGFDNKNVIRFLWNDRNVNVEQLRSEWMQHPDVLSVSNGPKLPLSGELPGAYCEEQHPEKVINAYTIIADETFIETYRIKLNEGRTISKESYPADREVFFQMSGACPEVIVNKKLVEQLGLKNPVGTVIRENRKDPFRFRIVGVVDDFHFLSLYQAIQPVFIVYHYPQWSSSMLVRYQKEKRQEVLNYVKGKYAEHFFNSEFSYWEYDYSQLYDKDIAMVKLIHVFTCMAIFISGMGIFAFSMFMAENRRKEVALRKVNGAAEWQIVRLLNRSFAVRVFIACLFGLPVAHYAMSQWLENFAYKTVLEGWIYLGVIGVCMVFVLLITTWQTWRVATVNPVDVLKNE